MNRRHTEPRRTRADAILDRLKDHPIIAVAVVITVGLAGLASLTDSLQKLAAFSTRPPDSHEPQPSKQPTAVDVDHLLQFTAAPDEAPADGASISSFTIVISPSVTPPTEVTFQTTVGSFHPEGTFSIKRLSDASRTVTVDVQSPLALGSARVVATAHGFSRETVIKFRRALPDRIAVTTSALHVTPLTSSAVEVSGVLLRDIGIVTPGTIPTFRATTTSGSSIGSFFNLSFVKPNGVTTATFLPGATKYRGKVTLTVGVDGTSVSGSTVIQVVDP